MQILLTGESSLAFLLCVALSFLLFMALRSLRLLISLLFSIVRFFRRGVFRFNTGFVISVLACAFLLWGFRFQAAQLTADIKQRWISPTYILPQDTSAWALNRYETELDRHVSPAQSELIRRRTREIAARIGSTPRAIYEVAFSECGLNPFAFNVSQKTGDTLAAGWIQFTRVGIRSLTIEGKPATFARVKQACRERDAALMMDLTEQYLVNAAAGRPLPNSTELYTAIFAPSYIGEPESKVLYSGHENPSYYLNSVLDGRRFYSRTQADGSEKIFWYRKPDGAITKQDLRLHLAWKCSKFLN